jgi:hypothetical protein
MISIFFTPLLIVTVSGKMINSPLPELFYQEQGVEGYAYRVSGNQMPSPDIKPSQPKGTMVSVYIYELTNINQVSRLGQSAFYKAIRTKFVRKLETGADGHFAVQLPAGSYSFFTKENELFYANWFDARNNIAPVSVMPGKLTRIEIRIDHDANY